MLSLPRGTEMFQFPRFPRPVLCVQTGVTPHDGCRVSPFGHPRIDALSAAPRGLSQPHTSFIGGRRLGIHRWLFVAWKNKDARARYAVLKGRGAADASGRVRETDRSRTARMKERTLRSLKTEERMERPAIAGDTSELEYRRRRTGQTSQCLNRCSEIEILGCSLERR